MGPSARNWRLFATASLALAGIAAAHAAGPSAPEERTQRLECFELRASADGPAVGFASLHRIDDAGATQLEWQVQFPAAEVNVWHVETRDARGGQWIWRERNAERARTVVAKRPAGSAGTDDRLELLEWGGPTAVRAALAAPAACAFPLELEERLRADEAVPASVAVFDPLSNRIEELRLACVRSDAGDGRELRRCELLRADGTLFAAWTFLERELASFAWQRGGLVAVRVDAGEALQRTIATGAQRAARNATTTPPGAAGPSGTAGARRP